MHSVTCATAAAPDKSRLAIEARRNQQRRHRESMARVERTAPLAERAVTRLHAALAGANRPIRARALARDLGLPRAAVTAELRRLQDVGAAVSHDRRWAATGIGIAPADHESTRVGRPSPAARKAS